MGLLLSTTRAQISHPQWAHLCSPSHASAWSSGPVQTIRNAPLPRDSNAPARRAPHHLFYNSARNQRPWWRAPPPSWPADFHLLHRLHYRPRRGSQSMKPGHQICAALTALSCLNRAPEAVKPATINLSILESSLQKCRRPLQFLQIHSRMIVTGYVNDTYAASRLLGFAASCGFVHLDYARRVFDGMENPNGFSLNAVMRAYVRQDRPGVAFSLYKSTMGRGDPLMDNFTHPIVLQACALRLDEDEGKQVHAHVEKMGFGSDVYVVNTLINMYSVCGNLPNARQMFEKSLVLDSVSWNSILAGYVQVGDVGSAASIFYHMPQRNTIASNSMIALFGLVGQPHEALKLFEQMDGRDVVSWTAMISCYEQNEMYRDALEMFAQMNVEGVPVDEVTMISILSACAHLVAVKDGELVHGLVVKSGIDSYTNLNNALINMYSSFGNIMSAQRLFDSGFQLDQISMNSMLSGYLKCGFVDNARKFFDSMRQKDVVSWSTMISGCAQCGQFSETLMLFHEMQLRKVKPDETTLVSVLSACGHLTALKQGKWVHAYIKKHGFDIDVILGTTLVDMYMKCGCVDNAIEVFDGMEKNGVSTWNALIIGLATNGMAKESLVKFSEMKKVRLVPNEVTFVGVLVACRYLGLVDEGRQYFNSMIYEHNIIPNVQHYGCLVDLLGRVGFLKEAEELIENMPMAPDVATWGALLGACRKHGDLEMGERIGRRLVELEPQHDGFHVLLSNIYASRGKWDDVMQVRTRMKQSRVMKIPGCSLIEANGIVHEFLAGDKKHPQIKDIERMLDEIERRLKMEGYKPDTSEVTLNIDEEDKETYLFRHSEKLAIAFGLISICPPAPIRITKNLRICSDCHAVAKAISKAFQRELVVRDRHLYHHFKEGVCSCADYW